MRTKKADPAPETAPEPTNVVAIIPVAERAVKALGYNEETRAKLKELAASNTHITEITNQDGREQVHTALMALKNTRIAIEKRGKAAREEATAFSKAVIVEEDSLIGIISPEEDRLQALRDKWDERIERERQALIEAEQKRQAEIQDRITAMRNSVNIALRAKTSADAMRIMEDIQTAEISEEFFGECKEAAAIAKGETMVELARIHNDMRAREEAAEALARDRAELDRQRAEQAEKDRKAAEARAAADRLAAEMNERLAELRGNQNLTATSSSELIAEHLHDLDKLPTDSAIFGPFTQQAIDAKAAGIARLQTLLTAAQDHEAEQRRIAEQRAENARIAAEQRAAQDRIDQANREIEARQQAERDAQAKREREEREAIEARERAEREAAAAAEQAERDRLAAVEREAERQRLENYRPTFEEIVTVVATHFSKDEDAVRGWIRPAKTVTRVDV